MASREALMVGIRIGATDETGSVIQRLVDNANSKMSGLVAGFAATGFAYKIKEALVSASDTFAEQQSATTKLRILEMSNLGKVNEQVYGSEEKFLRGLSGTYGKSIEEYARMVVIMRQNRLSAGDIMGDVGDEGAKLAKVLDNMDPAKAGLFFARLKNDLGVMPSQMGQLANMAYKMTNLGVGETPEHSMEELTNFYARAGLGARVLGLHGAKDAEDLGKLGAVFMAKGFKGQIAGTSFSKIFDGLRDTEKQGKAAMAASRFGIKLSFFDKAGQFKGLENFKNQLAKLSKLTIQQRQAVLKSFSTKQGLTTEEVEYLSVFSKEIDEMGKQYDSLANLNDAFKEVNGTLAAQNDATEKAKLNMKAAFGAATAQDVGRLNNLLKGTYQDLSNFATAHPTVTGFTEEIAGAGSVLVGFWGTLKGIGKFFPVFGEAAGAVASKIAGLISGLGELLAIKGFYDYSDKDAKENPNTMFAQNTKFYNGRIEGNKNVGLEKDGLIKELQAEQANLYWRSAKAVSGFINYAGGDKFYDALYGSKMNWYLPTENTYSKYNRFMGGQLSCPGSPGFNANDPYSYYKTTDYNKSQSASNNLPPFTYAPNLIMSTGTAGLTKEDVLKLMKQNSDNLVDLINKANERKKQMSY